MKFIHISDTHLGASNPGKKLSANGVSQREEDICGVFEEAVGKIIELKPEFVLHSGDLFHTVRPGNRIINFALRQFFRLSQAGIPTVMISGNHDAPKQKSIGSIHSIFEVLPLIYPVHKGQYEVRKLSLANGKQSESTSSEAFIHCIPHCLTDELFQTELSKLEISQPEAANILMLHGVVSGIEEFSMGEFAEQSIPDSYFKQGFDYVALGHYHKKTAVDDRVYYSGSTERISFNEIGQDKGFLEIELNKNGSPEFQSRFHSLSARPMLDLPDIDASGLDQTQLLERLEKQLNREEIKDKIVRLTVKNLPRHVYQLLDFRKLNQWKNNPFHCDLRFMTEDKENFSDSGIESIGRLGEEFLTFMNSIPVEGLDKRKLSDLGADYIRQAVLESEAEQGA